MADLIREGWAEVVDVAPGIAILHYPANHPDYPDRWALRHACPGVWHPDDREPFRIAPIIASDLVTADPLTFSPSLLCPGSARPCGLHGFVRDGCWEDAGTPADTMEVVRGG